VEAAAAAFFPFTAVATCGSKEKKDGLAAGGHQMRACDSEISTGCRKESKRLKKIPAETVSRIINSLFTRSSRRRRRRGEERKKKKKKSRWKII
jgi:hypothetical protein